MVAHTICRQLPISRCGVFQVGDAIAIFEYGTIILVFLETGRVHTWRSQDTSKWIAG